jgi:maltooligosyltrehalose trehalohydrolase
MNIRRRYPIGAEIVSEGKVHFRVWAPAHKQVEVEIENGPTIALEQEAGGYFSGMTRVAAGARYRLAGRPDPASRFQPHGPHGPSQIVDPSTFVWTDEGWRGTGLEGQVLYEMHVGTFTREGTWEAAREELPELAASGISVIELMPIADFPGRFGWGYDGVGLFAPSWLYGEPDDLRRFVNEAHSVGVGVILDVVYNHLGPDGNYLREFSPDYFTSRYDNEWGDAINFDGPNSGPVREYFLTNAAYWIEEFHLDGLRLDATQQIFDASEEHILAAIARRVRKSANGRATLLVAENEPQHTRLVRPPEEGGYGIDALWNDDFHHSAVVSLTGRNEAYYTDHLGKPQEFVSAVKYGYLFQGQRYKWQGNRRGKPTWGLRPAQFVTFIQNHDQVANSGRGDRIDKQTSPGQLRAMTALLLLAPGTPMLFQGQEFASSAPFHYFADHKPELSKMIQEGRGKFLEQFRSLARPEVRCCFADPGNPSTFERCKLDFSERERHAPAYRLHQDLLRLRREDPVFRAQKRRGVDGAVLSSHAFVLRYFGDQGDDRLLLVNLGMDAHLDPAPEPLLAPPEGKRWEVLWSSEDPCYGGGGTFPPDSEENWRIPGHAAIVLGPAEPGRERREGRD